MPWRWRRLPSFHPLQTARKVKGGGGDHHADVDTVMPIVNSMVQVLKKLSIKYSVDIDERRRRKKRLFIVCFDERWKQSAPEPELLGIVTQQSLRNVVTNLQLYRNF